MFSGSVYHYPRRHIIIFFVSTREPQQQFGQTRYWGLGGDRGRVALPLVDKVNFYFLCVSSADAATIVRRILIKICNHCAWRQLGEMLCKL